MIPNRNEQLHIAKIVTYLKKRFYRKYGYEGVGIDGTSSIEYSDVRRIFDVWQAIQSRDAANKSIHSTSKNAGE